MKKCPVEFDELLALDAAGRLREPELLRQQVERMLRDAKSARFVENFTGQWFDLRDIDFTEPDARQYPEFDEMLRHAMVQETHRFFREILDNDLPVTDVVDSDWAILNEFDQLAAEQIGLETRFASLTLSLSAGRGLSYSRGGVEIPSESRPSQLFARLFLEGKADEKQRQMQRLKDARSVMDAVLDNARRMQRRVGPRDRQKLDQYFDAVRATERRLLKSQQWEQRPKPQVVASSPEDIPNTSDVIGRARSMFDMAHLALQTDSTRLITLYNPGVNAVPPITGSMTGLT